MNSRTTTGTTATTPTRAATASARPRPTPRGTALGVAAAVLVLAGLALGRREAMALGLFLAVVVGASLAVLAARLVLARRIRLERTVVPGTLSVGGTARVDFAEVVAGLEDAVPGRAPVPVPADGYRWWPSGRGIYDVGPALARMSGPFGLWSGRAEVAGTSRVEVLPEPLDDAELDRVLRAGVGEREAADLLGSEAAPDDLLVREHRDGDALARVHWGATARTGRIMVRQEEWAHDPWAVVVLDCRAVSFAAGRYTVDGGAGRTWNTSPGFERAVQAATTLVERLEAAGHQVMLMDQDGRSLDPALSSAELGPSLREAAWPASMPTEAGAVIALLGTSVGTDLPVLATVPHSLHRVAVLFGHGPDTDPAHRLDSGGWLVADGAERARGVDP